MYSAAAFLPPSLPRSEIVISLPPSSETGASPVRCSRCSRTEASSIPGARAFATSLGPMLAFLSPQPADAPEAKASRTIGRLTLEEAISRADRVDWSISSEMWSRILVRTSRAVAATKQTYDLGADLIAYLVAPEYSSDDQREQLWVKYNFAKQGINLSEEKDRNDPAVQPLELPTPVTLRP